MTDFIFARVGLRYTCFSLPIETEKRNNLPGFDSNKTGDEVLQLCEKHTLFAELNGLYKTIPLKSLNPIREFITGSYKTLFTLHVPRSVFRVPRSVFRVPRFVFGVCRIIIW